MGEGQRPSERITEEVISWPGITAGPGRRGEFAFRVGRREIGHLHGIMWPTSASRSRSGNHSSRQDESTTTRSSPADRALARRIETEADIDDVIALPQLPPCARKPG